MRNTIIHQSNLKVMHRTGSEGPKHDPYHFEEYEVEFGGKKTTIHLGLGTWLHLPSGKTFFGSGDDDVMLEFEKVHGIAFPVLINWLERYMKWKTSRCRECGSRKFHMEKGYPGETFMSCENGHIISSCFNESAVL